MLVERTGDLFAATTDAIAHGCNCRGVMGAGIAKPMAALDNDMYLSYRERCQAGLFLLGECMPWYFDDSVDFVCVYNLATQVETGPDARLTAVAVSTTLMLDHAVRRNIKSIGVPRIGCGIGGLEWDDVKDVFVMCSDLFPRVELVVYTPPETS